MFYRLNYNFMKYRDAVNGINRKYVGISNRVTPAYTKAFGLLCDIYFPIWDKYNDADKYRNMEIFTPHQSPSYADYPDVTTYFYIPHLIKKQAMNSAEAEFDAFYTEEDAIDRPFIETSKNRELPIGTKVVVHQGKSISKFMIDKKLVVTGASGFMLLRMYLDPLAKDDDGETEAEKQTESKEAPEFEMNIPDEDD